MPRTEAPDEKEYSDDANPNKLPTFAAIPEKELDRPETADDRDALCKC